jgi:hypothetical protein
MEDLIPVTSSHIAAYRVNGSTLILQFLNGAIYEYHLLPEHIIEGFVNAASKGEFFHNFLKKTYRGTKI